MFRIFFEILKNEFNVTNFGCGCNKFPNHTQEFSGKIVVPENVQEREKIFMWIRKNQ